eukprot:TRINITY_DN1907_c0_g7_i1.p1 TRINITY_DN1907_c0_g7~~TRINITY_DN1907_c0_g7_i1.p1  ORF type:complete len:184 (-),score=65.86 TRINITY_DN1907_c0_g7_i1:125-676(-)
MEDDLLKVRMTMEEQSYAVKYLQCLVPGLTKVLLGIRFAQVFLLSSKKEWQETKLAGCLYIVERKEEAKYCLVLPSKQSLDILFVPIADTLMIEIKIMDTKSVNVIYLKGEDGKIYCVNFETAEAAKEAFALLEELKAREGQRKYSKELKQELTGALKLLALDDEFVEVLAEKLYAAKKLPQS